MRGLLDRGLYSRMLSDQRRLIRSLGWEGVFIFLDVSAIHLIWGPGGDGMSKIGEGRGDKIG